MPEPSSDYHDYVFRNGRLVGQFEEMYRNSAEVPWRQHEQEHWIDVRLSLEMLRGLRFAEIHDVGCGLGYYLDIVTRRIDSELRASYGYDISITACAKATTLFPDYTFSQFDLTRTPTGPTPTESTNGPRLFIIRGTLWYVFPQLANVVMNIRNMMAPNDRLLIVQNFPPLDGPFIGKDVLPDHHAIIRHFAASFSLRQSIWYEDRVKAVNDNWFIGLFSPLG